MWADSRQGRSSERDRLVQNVLVVETSLVVTMNTLEKAKKTHDQRLRQAEGKQRTSSTRIELVSSFLELPRTRERRDEKEKALTV